MMEYQYPLDLDWTNNEMMDVVNFFNQIEKYYESSVKRDQLMEAYKAFKNVVPSKSEEKHLFKSFEKSSGYNSYQVIQQVKNNPDQQTFSKNN